MLFKETNDFRGNWARTPETILASCPEVKILENFID